MGSKTITARGKWASMKFALRGWHIKYTEGMKESSPVVRKARILIIG